MTLQDNDKVYIGFTGIIDIAYRSTRIGSSILPDNFYVTAGSSANDPITISYANYVWTTVPGPCGVGGYDGGKRQIDCGFAC